MQILGFLFFILIIFIIGFIFGFYTACVATIAAADGAWSRYNELHEYVTKTKLYHILIDPDLK